MTRQEYIKYIANSAIRAVSGTKLFPSVLIAQATLESGNGNSSLSKQPYNNHFGIKAGSTWKGKKASFRTREVINNVSVYVNAYFRVYDSITESLKDRNSLLLNNSRYKKVLQANTAEQQTRELQQAGYATDPNYSTVLIQIIVDNNLKKYDRIAKINKVLPFAAILFLGAGATAFYKFHKS
ncbi:glucosaminidase domain-containing protein [Bernardetia sp. Wsw4-3y2]|uniref:glycoside hydrolase family 73 protein n=1 Tax=Bernardetia sp. Wsw4-3y2 TaxID=3127471 RepID=UPI0030D47BDB